MKFGIDVSHNNGIIDWKKVVLNNPKVDFAILKSSEGATNRDKKFINNVEGCVANRIPWGAYHFATFNSSNFVADAQAEAKFFLNVVNPVVKIYGRPQLPLVLDIESNKPLPYSRTQIGMYVEAFIKEIEAAGYEVAIYSSPGFLNEYLPLNHKFGKYKLWVADYTKGINPVNGWNKYWMHQYTDQGKCSGIITNCDLNKVL